ncbi:MAG: 3-oxoacyl-(acyl-carrier-protein) reductase [Bacteroidetes bacterium]|nr:3-oxoacyl-(acyl-carrier-protein) reductase [Bacteroidota bacterium]
MSSLDGKVALVTGGSRGIGKAVVQTLAESGARVAFTYRSSGGAAEALRDELTNRGFTVLAFQSDAMSFKDAAAVVENVVTRLGRLDILVNNAGITKDTLLLRMSEEDWDNVIGTNLKGVFNFTKAAIRPMMSQRAGKIINISSVVGITGNAGQANYAASKAGIIGFTKSVAKEVGSRNIQVNVVAPGYVETDMTGILTPDQKKALTDMIPLKRTARPEDVASVVRFLASADSDYMTGQTVRVDGGMTM